ncbi:MAG TPA: vitamin K epoxide reductase family protein [Myxococcaceae bacterium]|nr:vitamin K epoxide reductase family protein [Myxococcaceae bacterium]
MKVNRTLLPWMIVAGAAELLLASWQWFELESIRRGGDAPFCAINARVSCQTVWTSPMAAQVSSLLHVPVAGLGVVWGLVAAFFALLLWGGARQGDPSPAVLAAARATALAGAVSIPVFIVGSVQVGAVCLTCLGTYVLVAAYAALVVLCAKRERGGSRDLVAGAGMAAVAALLVGGMVYLQARALKSDQPTGSEEIFRLSSRVPANATPDQAIAAVLEGLPPKGRQFIADLRDYYLNAPAVGYAREPRQRSGPSDAAVRLVEWTDVRCPHCRDLLESMAVVRRLVPPGRISIESRQYPLDSDCNHALELAMSDHSGLHCLGAKAQICNEGTPQFEEIQAKLFAAQATLTQEKILEIAGSGAMPREILDRCVKSPETERRLQEDLAYAGQFEPSGTPFVIMNGKVMPPVPLPVFVYLLALADGRADMPAFATLPAPQRQP